MDKQELTQEQKEYYKQLRRKFSVCKMSEDEIKAGRERSELNSKKRMDALMAMVDLATDFSTPTNEEQQRWNEESERKAMDKLKKMWDSMVELPEPVTKQDKNTDLRQLE